MGEISEGGGLQVITRQTVGNANSQFKARMLEPFPHNWTISPCTIIFYQTAVRHATPYSCRGCQTTAGILRSSPPFIAEIRVPVPRCKYLSPEALAESRSEHYAVCAESGQPRGGTADEISVGADGNGFTTEAMPSALSQLMQGSL